MHRMQSGGWPYSKVGRDSSKALSLRAACTGKFFEGSIPTCACFHMYAQEIRCTIYRYREIDTLKNASKHDWIGKTVILLSKSDVHSSCI